MRFHSSLLAALLFTALVPASGQEAPKNEAAARTEAEKMMQTIENLGWVREGSGKLGSYASIQVPQGFRFTAAKGAKKMMEIMGNIPGDTEQGMIAPEDLSWFVIMEYDASGYVADTDKDKLDADAIISQIKEGQEQANEVRKERGLEQLTIGGWAVPPRYNDKTNNLEWGLRVVGETGESVNYLTKLLGRKGVMSVTLLCGPDELQSVLPEYQKLLAGFAFNPGQTYGEYVKGDKVADYTLAGLITAGAGFAAVKSGLLGKLGVLFAKLGKAAILVVVAIGAALKKLFNMLFRRPSAVQPPPHD